MNHITNTPFFFALFCYLFTDQCLKCYIDFSALAHNPNILNADLLSEIGPMVLTLLFMVSLVIFMRNIYINLNLQSFTFFAVYQTLFTTKLCRSWNQFGDSTISDYKILSKFLLEKNKQTFFMFNFKYFRFNFRGDSSCRYLFCKLLTTPAVSLVIFIQSKYV